MSPSRDYSSVVPKDVSIDEEVVHFFETFYKVSDNGAAHEEYVDKFTSDATFILASKTSKGSTEILQTRKAMWSAVVSRAHTVLGIYPFGGDSHQVMLYGTVTYGNQNGSEAEKDWAARATLEKSSEGGQWRMSFYQVYLV